MSTNVTLNYAGGRQWYRVPADFPSVEIEYNIVGGGGGGGGNDSHVGGVGGGASVAQGTITVKGNDLIEVYVGQGGRRGVTGGRGAGGASFSGYSGGAGAVPGPSGSSGGGGAGGGATVLLVNGVVKAVGGGGGGGGGGGNHGNGYKALNNYGAFNEGKSYILPRATIANPWSWFLKENGVWHNSGNVTTYYVNFPNTGVYDFFFSADNYGYMEIDGEKIIETSDYTSYATVSTTIGAGTRAVKIYAENWGGPYGFAGMIAQGGTGFWTTRSPTQPVVRSNGIAGIQTYGDEGGGGGGGGGYFGGVGGGRGYGDTGGKAGTLGKAYAVGGNEIVGKYSDQRFSSYPTSYGDGGTAQVNGNDGQAILKFTATNRDIWNKVGTAWKNCKEVFVKSNGAWKKSTEVYVKRNGVWKKSLTSGGSLVPSFSTDSLNWNTAFSPVLAAPPTTVAYTSYVEGVHAGGCGPAIAYGTLPTNNGTKTFAGRAPMIKTFSPYYALRPTKNLVFRGANVSDADMAKFGITSGFDQIPVVRAGQKLHWKFDVWVDHGWTFGFYHWNAKTTFSGPNSSEADYWDAYTTDYGAGGRQHPINEGDFIIPSTFSADEIIVVAWGDRRTGCPTGLSYLTVEISYKTY